MCSVGGSPTGVRARSPIAGMADRRETDDLKPIDKAILGMVSELPGRSESERTGGLETSIAPEAERTVVARRQHGQSRRSGCGD